MPIIKNQTSNFVSVPNSSARDKRLSIETRGVLAFLLSHSEDFDFSAEYLQRELDLGRDKVTRIIRELKENGYLNMKADHNKKGNFSGQKWFVYAESQNENFNTYRPTEKPSDGETDGRENRQTENTSDNKRKSSQKEIREEEIKRENLSPREFPKTSVNGQSGILASDLLDEEKPEFVRLVFDGLKVRLGTPGALPKEFEWKAATDFAWINHFSGERFLQTYDLLEKIRKKKRGDWRVTAGMIETNIADIERLEIELRNLENGKISGGNNREAQESKQIADSERLNALFADAERFVSPTVN